MTYSDEHTVNIIEAIADVTPLHADELRKCAQKFRELAHELAVARANMRDAAVLIANQREEIEGLRAAERLERMIQRDKEAQRRVVECGRCGIGLVRAGKCSHCKDAP